jgi:hypothetical protein
MISGTCGQEVGVHYDASEPGTRRSTPDEAKQRGVDEAVSDVITRTAIYFLRAFPTHRSQNQRHPQW